MTATVDISTAGWLAIGFGLFVVALLVLMVYENLRAPTEGEIRVEEIQRGDWAGFDDARANWERKELREVASCEMPKRTELVAEWKRRER